MENTYLEKQDRIQIKTFFTDVFTSAEGSAEGRLIGDLGARLSSEIDNNNIICIGACQGAELLGVIFFTRLGFQDSFTSYLLAPVGVLTSHQREGVGTSLINFGLDELKSKRVDAVFTYGDPAYYSRVGFQKISERTIKAPLALSMPEGWLGQPLSRESIPVLHERPTCVAALNDPTYW